MARRRSSLGRAFRNEAAYRAIGRADRPARWAVGFILKPTGGAYAARHAHEYTGVYVLRGSGRFVEEGPTRREHRVSGGAFCQHVPGRTYSLLPDFDGRWAEAYIVMDGTLYKALAAIGLVSLRRSVLHPGVDAGLVERFERILTDLQQRPDDELPTTAVRFHDLLAQVHRLDREGRADDPHTRLIAAACRTLGDQSGRRMPLPELAEQLGVGYERFRKVFTERMGLSPGEYRIRRRIDRARELIVQEQMSNKELAYALGYPDPFTFSKQFRRVVGESPAAFRRRMI